MTYFPNDARLAIVVSRFNEEVTDALLQGALARLKQHAIAAEKVKVVSVAGAVEIPIIAQTLIKTGHYEAVIALGAVIRGDTSHYDYVCQQVSYGCQQVALSTNVPVIFGVLTTDNTEQALARAGGDHGNKGSDAVDTALEMVATMRQLKQSTFATVNS
ncbi:MAG: 6,7-dimethyl-8-ribityllumazine synthase [Coxiellaceae bacterium]|nr:MAG: 6,7-dimethyl-8-ribityllumazine synthase [Coxiellaceae bacterium]